LPSSDCAILHGYWHLDKHQKIPEKILFVKEVISNNYNFKAKLLGNVKHHIRPCNIFDHIHEHFCKHLDRGPPAATHKQVK